MKNKTQAKKNTRNMASKQQTKSMKSLLSTLTDFIVSLIPDNASYSEEIKKALDEHQEELVNILKNTAVNKKTKKTKDPNAPKRASSSYILFCGDMRNKITAKNPDMSAKDIIKELGRVWREETSDKEKEKYTKLSEQDKQRYQEDMKDYTPPEDSEVVSKSSKKKASGPKRGMSAYIFFCNKHRDIIKDLNPTLSSKEITSELGKKWRELSEKDRKPFDLLATEDKTRYENEKNGSVTHVKSSSKSKSSKKKSKSKSKSSRKKSKSKSKSSKKKSKSKSKSSKKEPEPDYESDSDLDALINENSD